MASEAKVGADGGTDIEAKQMKHPIRRGELLGLSRGVTGGDATISARSFMGRIQRRSAGAVAHGSS